MAETNFACAAWSADEIVVYRRLRDQFAEERLSRRTPSGLRYFVRLFWRAGVLLLRTAEGEATVYDIAGKAGGFAPVRDWPEQLASLPIYRVIPLRDGSFAGLPEAENIVLLWREGQSLVVRALPPGFRACALDQDEHGWLYVAGSTVTARLRSTNRRHAFAVSADLGLSWDVDEAAHGGLATAWYSLLSGAEVENRSVTTAGQYLVLHAEAGEIGEESTLLYVRDPQGRWTSDVIRDDVFRAAVAVEGEAIAIFSHRGKVIVVGRTGRRHRLDLVPRLKASLTNLDVNVLTGARFEILAVDSGRADIVMLVSIHAPGVTGISRFGEAIFTDGIDVARMVHLQREPSPEIVTTCLLPER
jgi:hypothetical protein